jgi:hypothetical protein
MHMANISSNIQHTSVVLQALACGMHLHTKMTAKVMLTHWVMH